MSSKIHAFWGYEYQRDTYTFETKAEATAFCMGVAAGDGWDKHYLTNGLGEQFEVQENTGCDGWSNNWHEDDEPVLFDSIEAAEADLDEFIRDQHVAVDCGDMSEKYDRDNYRIIPAHLE